ncbi:MAG: hypothetical protein KAT78_00390 [Flavobacteriaceae bacterium]|nr:hypothetical protein [Flavobacteriaceae bacterium]
MKNNIIYFFLGALLLVSCNENKKELSQVTDNDPVTIESKQELGDAYVLLKNQCYVCHSISSVSHDDIIAPPMAAVKRRYLRMYNNKEDFVNAVSKWALNPEKDNAIMRGAVAKFNVMPKQVFKEEDLKKIAVYIYDNELEEPDWFKAHEKEMHGENGRGMGMGRNK